MAERRESIRVSDAAITIDNARFHLVWLRDNCPCHVCRDDSTTQKLFDITATDLAPRILSQASGADGVRILWDESPPHESVYSHGWLRDHAYDPPAQVPIEQIARWDGATWKNAPPIARRVADARWRLDVYRFGFSLLTGLDQPGYEALLHETGPIQPTEFGQIAPLRARPDANDIGETGLALDPHTDYTVYMQFPPTLNFLHCVRNDSDGGVSILSDGFAVAEHFRQQSPEAFDLLVRTPLPFHQVYSRWQYHHKRLRPMIELDDRGSVSGIHVGHAHTRNWQLPFDQMIPVYSAYAAFIRLMNDPAWHFYHRLQPGECLVFRNERVLHGRTGFSPQTGERHLQIAYVCWSYFTARDRFTNDQRPDAADAQRM